MTKSMIILYTYCNVSDHTDPSPESLLTIATFLEVFPKSPVQVKVESIPDIVTWLVDDLCPLENAFGNHIGVHGNNTEPEDPLYPAFGEFQQRNSKCCFT